MRKEWFYAMCGRLKSGFTIRRVVVGGVVLAGVLVGVRYWQQGNNGRYVYTQETNHVFDRGAGNRNTERYVYYPNGDVFDTRTGSLFVPVGHPNRWLEHPFQSTVFRNVQQLQDQTKADEKQHEKERKAAATVDPWGVIEEVRAPAPEITPDSFFASYKILGMEKLGALPGVPPPFLPPDLTNPLSVKPAPSPHPHN